MKWDPQAYTFFCNQNKNKLWVLMWDPQLNRKKEKEKKKVLKPIKCKKEKSKNNVPYFQRNLTPL